MAHENRVIAGRYRLLEQIGRGGFGRVFRAEQLGLTRPVALKLLHENLGDSTTLARFDREARIAQRLEHPNTVKLFDYGRDSDGTLFIVYELLQGPTLAQALAAASRFSPERARHVTRQILKALAEAHSLGIVHRDLKPANVMLVRYSGEEDYVKVLDFGIARSLRADTQVVTALGEVMGTPAYMAPEHLRGEPPTPRSDVYSVGLMLAEMLSGRRVYGGSQLEVGRAQVASEPVPLPPLVESSSLGAIIRRATRKRADQRFADAQAMLAALDSEREDHSRPEHPLPLAPTSAEPVPHQAAQKPASRLRQRRNILPLVAALLAALLAVVMAAVVVLFVAARQRAASAGHAPTSPVVRQAALGLREPRRADLLDVLRDVERVVHATHPEARVVAAEAPEVREGLVDVAAFHSASMYSVMLELEDQSSRILVMAYPNGYSIRESLGVRGTPALGQPRCSSRQAWAALSKSQAEGASSPFMAVRLFRHGEGTASQRLAWAFTPLRLGAGMQVVDAQSCEKLP